MTGQRETGSTADSLEPIAGAGTESVQSEDFPSGVGEIAYLVDVRAARHDGFDRVVLELDGDQVPSYRVSYVRPPILRDGSGEVVSVQGEAFLELRMTPASGWDITPPEPSRTYTGPARKAPPRGEVVTEVVLTADFEATLAWTVGLTREVPFAAEIFRDPLRLVVDIRHE